MKNLNMIREYLESRTYRSAWDKGVQLYVSDLLDQLQEAIKGHWLEDDDLLSPAMLDRALLNGASSWAAYSYGGCALCYDPDIAERLCTPPELERTRNGDRNPNGRENWLDVQARALCQAAARISNAAAVARQFVG